MAVHFARAGVETVLWARSADLVDRLRRERENADYLPGVELPQALDCTADLADTVDCGTVVVVVPSHGFRQVVSRHLAAGRPDGARTLVSATKGIEGESLSRMSGVSLEEAEKVGLEIRFAVLSGPSFAEELVAGCPTAAVIAAEDAALARDLRERLSSANLRLYSSTDVAGVELGGTVKNVVAIAAGVLSGLGLGSNARAALITRGLHEMTRLGVACGGEAETFAGLAGLGDLVLTSTSGQSRNERLGQALGRGRNLDELMSETPMVAEGVKNSKAILALARQHDLEMPITEQMVAVLYDGKSPRVAVNDLMARSLRAEGDD